jgi:hypothetical protein
MRLMKFEILICLAEVGWNHAGFPLGVQRSGMRKFEEGSTERTELGSRGWAGEEGRRQGADTGSGDGLRQSSRGRGEGSAAP